MAELGKDTFCEWCTSLATAKLDMGRGRYCYSCRDHYGLAKEVADAWKSQGFKVVTGEGKTTRRKY